MTATPSAPDTIRETVFIAEATPDRAAGTAPTTASVAGAIVQPIDSASRKNQPSSTIALVDGSHSTVLARSTPTPVSPAATTGAVPSRSTARLDDPAPITSPSASGL